MLKLAHRLRRWPSIELELPQLFAVVESAATDSEKQVSAYFTRVQILSIEALLHARRSAVGSAKGKYIILDLQVGKYDLLQMLDLPGGR